MVNMRKSMMLRFEPEWPWKQLRESVPWLSCPVHLGNTSSRNTSKPGINNFGGQFGVPK